MVDLTTRVSIRSAKDCIKDVSGSGLSSAPLIQGVLEKIGVPEGAAEFIGGGAGERLRGQFERNRGNFRGRGLQNFGDRVDNNNRDRGGNTVIIQAGTVIADEGGVRELERRLKTVRLEETRTRGTR